jgi:ATP-dependent helicase/nuclease subunit B
LPFYANKLLSAAAPLREKSCVQARFLLGPAGSGKTFRCLAEIRAALKRNPEGPFAAPERGEGRLILLAPKQATFQLERQLLADVNVPGYTRLQIVSFERLARFVLETFSVAPPQFLSDEGRVMVLRAWLLRHEAELKLFRHSARRPGFAQELSALLNEFQQHQLTSAKLHALSQRAGLPAELRDKLHDLALLAEAHANWLAEHELQDANCLLNFATDKVRSQSAASHPSFAIHHLWLDGFAEMTPQELDLLAAVLPFCERATLAFCLDGAAGGEKENSWLSIWAAVGKTFSQCRQRVENLPGCKVEVELLPRGSKKSRFAQNPAMRVLEEFWPRPAAIKSEISNLKSQISITACANADAEATYAAREILKFVRGGSRFRDCAVLVRDLEPFHKPLARAFRRYEIPFFLDRRESVAHHPLAELTRSVLRTVAFDWRHNDWFAALKSGFAPADEVEIDRLENEALARGWRGKRWRKPIEIADNPAWTKPLEELRQKILPPFENFAARLSKQKLQPTGAQLADALRELWGELGVEETLERWTLDGENSAPRTPHSALHATVLGQMNSWLDNLALAFPREPLALRNWLPIVDAGLANLTVGVIPPVLDEVLIGAVDRARNPDLKFALVLGINEGTFPAAPAPATILTDADRNALSQAVLLGPDLRERLARERYYGYIACTRASEKLTVTFSRHDADGKALNPSPFIAPLQKIFPRLEIEEFQNEIEPSEAEHATELVAPLVEIKNFAGAEVTSRKLSENPKLLAPSPANQNWQQLLELPVLKLLAEQLRQLREPAGDEKLSPMLAERLYGPVLETSVSRLEEFAQCPFRFFVHSGLRAEERKMFELDARERGSFQHEVLKLFHEQLAAEGKRWRDLTPQEARERVSQIAAGLVEDFREGLMRDTAQTRFEARAMAEALQDFIAVIVSWMRGQYEFDPAAAELDFGTKESPQTAWKIDLEGGRRLLLRGRIDRIDLCREGGRALAVVMDYKSSNKKLDALLVEHGVQLQLLAYLNVLRRWKNPRPVFGVDELIPTGVFYVNLRGQFENGKTRDEVLGNGATRKSPYLHTGRFDAGALDKLDRKRVRDQFTYRLTESGKLYANSVEALPRAEFEKLLDGVEMRLKEMGRAIFSGESSVDPYRKGAETPCEFCDYASVCRIDPWTHSWRVLRAEKENPA